MATVCNLAYLNVAVMKQQTQVTTTAWGDAMMWWCDGMMM